MNITVTRLITITAAIALTALGSVSVAQAKQGADDVARPAPNVVDDRGLNDGRNADDLAPHLSGTDDATSNHRTSSHMRGSHHRGAPHHRAQHT
jgi:hypothetical protein